MDRDVEYTSHALQRIKQRFISKQDVVNAVRNEEWQSAYGDKKKSIYKVNGNEIEVILKSEDNNILVKR